MGKKHKKHKGEKHGYEGKGDVRGAEYVEKPLKLVLKVGTGEVKELSTARATALLQGFHEDKSDHDKHKEKKKKKKKKTEKVLVPNEEKKKKKDDKKKKDRNENAANKEQKMHSSLGGDIPAVTVPDSSLSKPEEEQTPLQEALNQLVRQLQRKDPGAFFSFPVTDFIAPGYSLIIKNPMDFSTMKEKIRNCEYRSIEEFKENFKQICHNAMIYNKPGTIYYRAAKKLLNSGIKILSQERIQSLKQSIEFMSDLQNSGKEKDKWDPQVSGDGTQEPQKDESMDTDEVATFRSPVKDQKRKEKDLQEDKQKQSEAATEKEQEQIDQIIKESFGKLSKRVVNSQFEFERRKSDGTTTLALLSPGDLYPAEAGHGILGSTAGRLQAGVNSLQGFKEDKRNKVTPVLYLNYGPFTSYAPCYDSTFANVGKDDSDLIYSTYGEEPSLQGTFRIQEFLENTLEKPYGMADCILDAFTDGEYSRTERDKSTETVGKCSGRQGLTNAQDQFACLKNVFGLGIFDEVLDSEEAEKIQQKLDETTRLLQELQEVQYDRLSTKPPPNMVCLLAPSAKELQIAERVNDNLKLLAQQVQPGDIVSIAGLRKAMGITLPFLNAEESEVDLTDADTEENTSILRPTSDCPLVGT
ncbi:bromodomain-containing protein 7 [Xenopus laevis]|uniref:BRD7 protein n=1 Tax=Xenopus laevis TaxID=8355 RepID=Q802C4_XENLA|nr:bromodomain-containing protein 7 [Xenopus laevis]AAH70751.1 BRD7 protein [Xenopus laevis]AAO85270.1 nuclear transcriptor-like protein [Xenopus laevis]